MTRESHAVTKVEYMGQWIAEEQAQGANRAEILAGLHALGWHPKSAEWAFDQAAAKLAGDIDCAVPFPQLAGSETRIDLGDRALSLLMHVRRPQALLLGDFLSPEECDDLIAWPSPSCAAPVCSRPISRPMPWGRRATPGPAIRPASPTAAANWSTISAPVLRG